MIIYFLIISIPNEQQSDKNIYNFKMKPQNRSLSKLEQSILRQYKRLSFGQETPQYQYQSVYYSQLPSDIPSNITNNHSHCIILYSYSFYEMITFGIFQFLFVGQNSAKKKILAIVKELICSEEFMFGSHYIKGLLVKGLRLLSQEKDKRGQAPIAQILMNYECMSAFTEFWKEISQDESVIKSQINEFDPNTDALNVISQFLGIPFKVFWKRQNQYEQQILSPQNPNTKEHIHIIISSTHMTDSIVNKLNISKKGNSFMGDISSIQGNCGYLLLLQKQPQHKLTLKKQNKIYFDEMEPHVIIKPPKVVEQIKSKIIKEIDYTGDVEESLKCIKRTMVKGDQLIDSMNKFIQKLSK